MNVEIRKLSKKNLDDYLYFFDTAAFCDNPEWSGCYCYFFYIPDDETWLKRSKDQNREEAVLAIKENRMNGYLAYLDNNVVGWCNADTLANYPRIVKGRDKQSENLQKTASIVCFIVDVNHRRKGIAKKLLQVCCDDLKKSGYAFIEAYPMRKPANDAENYHGPLSLYQSGGFTVYKELEKSYIVRKTF